MGQAQDDIQKELFRRAGLQLPAHVSLAAELSALLDISVDSAYRRLRGDTEISLAEAGLISRHFGLRLDGLSGEQSDYIHFRRDPYRGQAEDLDLRFRSVLETLAALQDIQEKEIFYFSMELPIFHLMQFPLLLAFKLHYWRWIDLERPTEKGVIDLEPPDDAARYARIVNLYLQIPSTEIIYEDALSTTMMQILFFLESGSFARQEDALSLFDELEQLAGHLRREAGLGCKFLQGTAAPDKSRAGNFKLYYNEMIFSQNVACIQTGTGGAVFLEHNVLDFLHTDDREFYHRSRAMLDKIMRKSILISRTSERERNKFFNRLDQSIARMRKRAEGIVSGW